MGERPAITGTTHVLPFSQLLPADFERLCLALIAAEGYDRPEHYGLGGADSGRDVVAYKVNGGEEERWVFQAKHWGRVPASEFIRDLDKVVSAERSHTGLCATGLIFLVSSKVSASVRDTVSQRARELDLRVEIWAVTELDLRVRRHYNLLTDFFWLPPERLIKPTELSDELSHLLFSRLKVHKADVECIAAFQALRPILERAEIYDETSVALVWGLVHHISISHKHGLWKRRALEASEFRISDLAPFSRTTQLWFKDPAYRNSEQLAGSIAKSIAKRGIGLQARKRGFVRRVFIDRKRTHLDKDGRQFLRLLKRQAKSEVQLFVVLSDELPQSIRAEPHEISVVGKDLATTFEYNDYTHYIVPLERPAEAIDQYSELERFAVSASEYIHYLSSLPLKEGTKQAE